MASHHSRHGCRGYDLTCDKGIGMLRIPRPMRSHAAMLLTLLMLAASLSGCFGGDDGPAPPADDPFDFEQPITNTTWYHYANATNALNTSHMVNGTSILIGNNTPFLSIGTYYGIGMSTFEPTIGATSDGNLYMSSWGNGPAGSTAIVKCTGMNDMITQLEYSCANSYDPLVPVANSNDPYVYVDPWTDRIMKFDMHALLGMTVEWSDTEGASWPPPPPAPGGAVQDPQPLAS